MARRKPMKDLSEDALHETGQPVVSVWRIDAGHIEIPETELARYLKSGWVLSSTRRK